MLLALLAVAPLQQSKAQNVLGIGGAGLIGMPDTARIGDTISFSYFVVNNGVLPTVGPIYSYQAVNGNVIAGFLDGLLTLPINPGDSAQMIINQYIFTNQTHGQGGGTTMLTIWPGPGTQDSATKEIFLLPELNSREEALPRLTMKIYPNPAKDQLHLSYAEAGNRVESISVFDMQGREVIHANENRDSLNVNGFNSGLYIIEVRAKGKAPARMKFLKD